jgi:hypothetical protein
MRLKADSHIACRAHAVPLPCRAAKGLECVFPIWFTKCGRVWFIKTWSVNQTRPHCVSQMGKTHSKPLAARHGRGTAWARYAMCESAFTGPCIVIYFYSRTNDMHQFLKFILFCSSTLHVSDGSSVHHQESKTVHTASGIPDVKCYYKTNLRKWCISLVLLQQYLFCTTTAVSQRGATQYVT